MNKVLETLKEVFYAVLPVTIVVIILQFTIVWLPINIFIQFLVGVTFVSIGLVLFLLGVNIGLLPIGEMIGSTLLKTNKMSLVISFSFLLGFVSTIAEPDLRVLATQVDFASKGAISKDILIYSVSFGVAIFVGIAMLRIILDIPMSYIFIVGYGLIFLLSAFAPQDFIPISFDAGGVTTGAMTVPFILALGLGASSVIRGKSSSSNGFGLVGIASIGPILAVLILGVIFR